MPRSKGEAYESAGNKALAALREAERRLAANPQAGALADHATKTLRNAEQTERSRGRRTTHGVCVYCGDRCRSNSNPATCRLHSDLPARDPNYEGLS